MSSYLLTHNFCLNHNFTNFTMPFSKAITGDNVLEVYDTQLSGSYPSSLATRKVDNFNIVFDFKY